MDLGSTFLDIVTLGRSRRVRESHRQTVRAHDQLMVAVDAHLAADQRLRQQLGEAARPRPAAPEPDPVAPPLPIGRPATWAGIAATSLISAGLAPTTAWALVGTFGTASTGAAIASLHGVAATNATLAWFGGGAIADGGGGMAMGALMLAFVGLVPALAVWAVGGRLQADRALEDLEAQREGYVAQAAQAEEARALCVSMAQRAELQARAAQARTAGQSDSG